MAPLISPDGYWWWDGRQWRSRMVEGELDLFWFTSTPDWMPRILLMGLIGLIPIVGSMVLYGWTLAAADMVRRRWRELPPPGFQYLERGVAPFAVFFVYGIAFAAVLVSLGVAAIVMAVSGQALLVPAILLGVLAALLAVAGWLLVAYLYAALLVVSDSVGIGAALNPRRVLDLARANHAVSLKAGLIYGIGVVGLTSAGAVVGAIVPFGSFLTLLVMPAVFAVAAPVLAGFSVSAGDSVASTI